MTKKTFIFLIVCFISIVIISCGGSKEESLGSSEVKISAVFVKSDSSLIHASALTHIRYIVSGPGMKTMTGVIPVQGNLVEFILNVPNGKNRHFLIEALDSDQYVRYSGEAYRDLDGTPITIVIELVEVALDISGDWLFYRTAIGDISEKGPFCRKITQAGELLTVIGYERELGEIKGSGIIKGHDIELNLKFNACNKEGFITIIATTTDGNTISGTFTLTGGCIDVPLTGSWRAEKGKCPFPKAEVSVRIAHFEKGYYLEFLADELSEIKIETATVTGPDIETLNLEYTCSVGSCRWFTNTFFGQTKPTPQHLYSFTINYTDGTSDTLTDSVYDIGVGFPVLISPKDGEIIETSFPTFSWQPPDWGCASWYHLIVTDSSGNEIWWPAIPKDTTSVIYNFDGTATTALQPGNSYSWSVNAFDDCQNQNEGHDNFAGSYGGIFYIR